MKKFLGISTFLVGLAASQVANAATISLTVGPGGSTGDYILGEVFQPSDLGGGLLTRDTAAVNGLLAVGLGVRAGTSPEYYRSTTNFGSLPAATTTGAGFAGSIGAMTVVGSTIQIVLPSAFNYLVAAYDGSNAGAEVYYIGGIASGDTIELLRYAEPDGVIPPTFCGGSSQPSCGNLVDGTAQEKFQITTWTLLNPTSVPDGGTTAVLLGLSMLGLGFARSHKAKAL